MDIKQLRYFLGVLKAKSFTRAAESLHIAQPAIGMQIRNLEAELEVKLLVRHSRGIAPTEAGSLLARRAEVLLRDFEEVRQEVIDIGGEPRGQVSMGITITAMHVLAAALVDSCRRKYPAVSLNFSEGMSERLSELLSEDRLDLALTYNPPQNGDVVSEPLAVESLCFAISNKHQAAKATQITLDEALQNDIIFSSRSSLFRKLVEDAAKARGVELRVVCEVNSVPMIKELVRNGLGCAITPYGAVRQEAEDGKFVALPLVEPQINRILNLTYLKKRLGSRAMDAICDEVREIVSDVIANGAAGWSSPSSPAEPLSQPKIDSFDGHRAAKL